MRDKKKKKYSNSCVVRKEFSERNKKPYPPPFKLNGRSLRDTDTEKIPSYLRTNKKPKSSKYSVTKISDDRALTDSQRKLVKNNRITFSVKSCSVKKHSSKQQRELSQEIIDMRNKGVIIDFPACKNQFLSNLFLVSKKDGGQRPVVNLR